MHDRMTEEVYQEPLRSFRTDVTPAPVFTVPLLERGRAALEEINEELGLGFDEWDKDYYLRMFTQDLERDPTSVELFDMAQSNSEHRCLQDQLSSSFGSLFRLPEPELTPLSCCLQRLSAGALDEHPFPPHAGFFGC